MAKFDEEFIQFSEEKKKSEKKTSAFSLSVQILLYIVFVFFAIFFIWWTAFISTHKYFYVYGASMKNTLNSSLQLDDENGTEDAVYVNTIAKVKVFDTIVAKRKVFDAVDKKWKTKNVVKRVMALEGDFITIALREDEQGQQKLYFFRIAKGADLVGFDDEDARLDESKGANGYTIFSHEEWTQRKDLASFEKEGMIDPSAFNKFNYEENFFSTFLSGHLAEIASGSDDFFVSDAGLVYVRVPKGQFFCMGDNRGHSSDCRDNGFYDMPQIVGRVDIVVYDYSFTKRLGKIAWYYFTQVGRFFAR